MTMVFLVCAIVGGTLLVCQFVLTLIGLGGAHGDMDFHMPHDVGGELGHSHGGDVDHGDGEHHGSSWLFGVISFRTVVAAITFFGLVGLTAESAGLEQGVQILLGVVFGGAAMYGVHGIMTMFKRLGSDGTLRIQGAVGQTATVYVPIPGKREAAGKVHVEVQGQLAEFAAMTSGQDKLPTGTRVLVIGLVSENTLEVERVRETKKAPSDVVS